MPRLLVFLTLFLAACSSGFTQKPAFRAFDNDSWVTSKLDSMTLREKISQLIIIDVYPSLSKEHKRKIEGLIKEFQPGGIIIMDGSPTVVAGWINDFQKISEIPLITALDGETGAGFRLDSILNFPNAQSLGAVQNNELLHLMGKTIGKQLRLLGFNMNLAPVADINTNPENPVINSRSFGENRDRVTAKTLAFVNGLQEEGVAAVAKHFPGHGDTFKDSHHTLPILNHSSARLDSVEIWPFRILAENGIAGIMTAHLGTLSVDPSGRPASLSAKVINGLLKEKLKYEGLIVTDAMNMKGNTFPSGKAEVQALKAGNDMLEFVKNLDKTVTAIETAVTSGTLTLEEIDLKVRKVLAMKRWLGLHQFKHANECQIVSRINNSEAEYLSRKLTAGSLTLLKNNGLIPITAINKLKIATIAIGADTLVPFQHTASFYAGADHYFISKDATPQEAVKVIDNLKGYSLILAGIHEMGQYPKNNYRISESQKVAFQKLVNQNKVITLFFGNAYAMEFLPDIARSEALVVTYQESDLAQDLAVQMVFGAIDANGRIPVSSGAGFTEGSGIDVKGNKRLRYAIPEEAGISSEKLKHKIDSLAMEGLDAGAYPGCQVLVARDGKIIFHQCYGWLTFDKKEPVTPDKLYDFASVTKVSGPLPAVMKLYDEGKLKLNKTLGDYWSPAKNTNKQNILMHDILTHQAQLPAIIPFWNTKLARNRELREKVFKSHPVKPTDVRISSSLYMDRKYIDTMYREICTIPLLKQKRYSYTCMGFTLWPPIIEKLTGKSYEDYIKNTFYRPLGALTLTYNPYKYFPLERIIPTEQDDYFRMETLRGFVHDEGAAMLGGISGNAGLFGTTGDLAKLFQMYLWKGYYGGERFISEKTVNEFIRVQFPENNNRRGLGFDKPSLNNSSLPEEDAYPAPLAGPNSFGHSGYTGTFVWADPDQGLLFLLMTNRVQPTRNNNRLSELGTRGAMLQALYELAKEGAE